MEVECPHAGAVCWWKAGGACDSEEHSHKHCGGGVYLQDEGQASGRWEQHTRDVENNTAGQAGGGVSSYWCGVLVESGAALVIQKNIATSFHGGGVPTNEGSKPQGSGNSTRVAIETTQQEKLEVECPHLVVRVCWWKAEHACDSEEHSHKLKWWRCVPENEGSSLRASGNSTRVTIENNTAGQAGGGVSSFAGASVLVESGAALVIQKNIATSFVVECVLQARVKPQGEWEQRVTSRTTQQDIWRWSVLSCWCGHLGGKRSRVQHRKQHLRTKWCGCFPQNAGQASLSQV